MTEKIIEGTFAPIEVKDGREIIKADKKYIKWEQDPKGYFLIKVDKAEKVIKAGFCTNDNKMTKEFVGKTAEELYHTMLAHNVISVLAHACNMGIELAKAEIALKYNLNYVQDDPLVIKQEETDEGL